MRATWLPDVLRAAGLPVSTVPGWESRGHGEMVAVEGVICHHTGGSPGGNAPSLGTVRDGRPDLAGPLSCAVLARDGTWIIVAAGKSWHAGAGDWRGITDANGRMLGVEAEATGGQSWPAVQYQSYVRGVAAILAHIGRGAEWAAGHKEYALPKGRKDDPNFDMNAFRRDVAAILGAQPNTPNPQEDDMFDDNASQRLDTVISKIVDVQKSEDDLRGRQVDIQKKLDDQAARLDSIEAALAKTGH